MVQVAGASTPLLTAGIPPALPSVKGCALGSNRLKPAQNHQKTPYFSTATLCNLEKFCQKVAEKPPGSAANASGMSFRSGSRLMTDSS